MGAIQAGSLFATLQAIAMGGIGGSTIALGGMTGGAAAAAAISTVCAAVDGAAAQSGQVGEELVKAVAAARTQPWDRSVPDAPADDELQSRAAPASASIATASASSYADGGGAARAAEASKDLAGPALAILAGAVRAAQESTAAAAAACATALKAAGFAASLVREGQGRTT